MDAPEPSSASRVPLPEGTIPVGIGLLVAGLCSFAFFRVGVVALGSEEAFKPVVSMWFATFALAPGLFLPLEQELGRAISHRRAIGQGARPVVRKVTLLPHVGSATRETRGEMARLVIENLAAHFAGQPLVTPVI